MLASMYPMKLCSPFHPPLNGSYSTPAGKGSHLDGSIHGSPRTQQLHHHLFVPGGSTNVKGIHAILQQQPWLIPAAAPSAMPGCVFE
jgi:hypothetical protein